ncbi:MAG TPA: DUF6438 domain-containing protein [Caulobacteraceae bacterium]
MADAAPPAADVRDVHIRLERSGCLSACPQYSIELNGDGPAIYRGGDFVLVKGRHAYWPAPGAIGALLTEFKAAGFWSLRPEYVARTDDAPRNVLSVTIDGNTTSVVDFDGESVGMPPAVTALEGEVDAAAGVQSWVKGDAKTLTVLRAEGFDFHSQEAGDMLASAAAEAPEDLIVGLIAAGAPLAAGRSSFLRPAAEGSSALEQAISAARPAIVHRLIAAGALDAPGAREKALRSAAGACDPGLVGEILALRPNVNAGGAGGSTALMIAAGCAAAASGSGLESAGPKVIDLLIAAGADVRAVDDHQDTALHRVQDPAAVGVLLRGGARLEARNDKDRTPLLTAGSENISLTLLDAGANPTAVDKGNQGLAAKARRLGWARVLARLGR